MTEQEAKEHLEARLECMNREMAVSYSERCDKNCDACDLLYAQGTIGEIKETYKMGINALEKQIAKKPYVLPINREENFTYCPNCKRNGTLVTPSYVYCTKCGQKIDWGNEDAE